MAREDGETQVYFVTTDPRALGQFLPGRFQPGDGGFNVLL